MLLSTKFGGTLLLSNRLLRQAAFHVFFSPLSLFFCTASLLLPRLFLVARSGGYCFVLGLRLLLAVASFVEHKLWGSLASVVAVRVLSSCSSPALEPGVRSCGAWGLVAPRHVESSQTQVCPLHCKADSFYQGVLFHFFSERTCQ